MGAIGPNPAISGRQEDGEGDARSERAPQGVLIHRDHQPLRVDAAWAALHGYSTDAIMAMDTVVGLISPRHRERMVAHCQTHLSGQPAPSVYEYQAVHASGRLIWCAARLQAIDWDGAPAVQSTISDITEQKKAEDAPQDSEARFRDLFEASFEGILIHRDHKPLLVNKTWAAIHGYTTDEIMALDSIVPLMSAGDRERLVEYKNARLRGEKVPDRYEYQAVRKDGTTVWLENLVRVVTWDGAPAIQCTIIDITERKVAEHALLESEARFRDIFEGAFEGILIHRDHKPLLVNKTWAEIHGYTTDEILALDSTVPLISAADQERMVGYKNARMRGEKAPERYEYQGVRKDGTTVWLETLVGVMAWDGEPAIHSTIIDISERKVAEDALRESEQRFRDVANGLSDWIWEQDENLRFTYFSDRFHKATGRPAQEVLGKTRIELLWPEDEEVWATHLDDLTARRPFRNFRYRQIAPNGTLCYICVSGVPIFDADGTFRGYRGTGADLTAEVEAEEALRRSQTRFLGAFETAVHGMALTDPEGRFFEVNPALCTMLGFADTELRRHSYESVVHPEDLARGLDNLGRMRAGEIRSFQHEERWSRSDGDVVWVLASVALVPDAEGAPDHLVWQLLDLTERKKADERLRQSQKMEAIGQLTGGVAHDFNNLLTVILGNARLLERRLGDDSQGNKMADSISKAAKRGADLVQHLLAFSRKQTLETRAVDVGELVEGIHAMLRRTLEEDIEITSDIGDDLHDALVDPSQLEAALLNLSVNARDAMPHGGTLTIGVTNFRADDGQASAEVHLSPDRDYVAIAVSDTGTGIPPELVKQIFEPFFTTKDVGKGTGLGLSMVFGFIQQSGGQIHVDSEIGRGTTVTLYLPAAEAKGVGPTCAAAANGEEDRGHETILVVEDKAEVRQLAAIILRSLGYSVIEAENGPAALEVLTQPTDIDLLFTDLVMPGGMNGKDLASAAKDRRPDIKVLFTTGYSSGILSENRDVGDDGPLITKPYDDEALSRKVREVLDAGAH